MGTLMLSVLALLDGLGFGLALDLEKCSWEHFLQHMKIAKDSATQV